MEHDLEMTLDLSGSKLVSNGGSKHGSSKVITIII